MKWPSVYYKASAATAAAAVGATHVGGDAAVGGSQKPTKWQRVFFVFSLLLLMWIKKVRLALIGSVCHT